MKLPYLVMKLKNPADIRELGWSCRVRKAFAVAGPALVVLVQAQGSANAAPGDLTKKTGSGACVSADGSEGTCDTGKASLLNARSTVISPDGKHLYVAFSQGLGIYGVNQSTGAIAPKAGQAGCIAEETFGECASANRGSSLERLAISPDGKSIYGVTGYAGDLVPKQASIPSRQSKSSAAVQPWR